jgi:cytochrome c553
MIRPCHMRITVLAMLSLQVSGSGTRADDLTGEQIYMQQCARCHGARGDGTTEVGAPLVGDRSLQELAKLIRDTMPEDKPEKCSAADSEKVAAYIHEAFYSILAQERNRPARVELSHLTVRQHENAVADIIESFFGERDGTEDRGLEAEYYKERKLRKEARLIERTDPQVDFQFGNGSPDKQIGNEEFSIQWEGSLLPPETGLYELIVETENGARLFLNDENQPFIDISVRSGDQREYRETIRLLAGRAYRLRLEYFKHKEKTASIRLMWKPPLRPVEVIPQRGLSPKWSPRTFVLNTPFPPDDRSRGYERGSAVSKEWYDATTQAALEVANAVVTDLDRLSKSKAGAGDRSAKVQEFCGKFTEKAFRRPLSDEDRQFYIERHFAEGVDIDTATRRTITLVLQSPKFLYREVNIGDFDDYDVASWLAFSLWDSIPDQRLREAAGKGQLKTREQIASWAERMLQSPKARAKTRDFVQHWLRLDHHLELTKDQEAFPQFTPEVVADLHASLDLFVDDIVWKRSGDFRELLNSDRVYLNGRLAAVYGGDLPDEAPFQAVSLPDQARAGLLSHPLVLACLAYEKNSSPIHRGVFVSRSLLGRRLKTPPIAVAPLAPDLHKDLTTRERITLQTSPQACQSCHTMINPLGFTLESFDAIGRFRSEENSRPVDASGSYIARSGDEVKFQGSLDLARFLVESPECRESFVEQMFHHLAKQPVRAFGNEFLSQLSESFRMHDYNIRQLMVELVTESALHLREHP